MKRNKRKRGGNRRKRARTITATGKRLQHMVEDMLGWPRGTCDPDNLRDCDFDRSHPVLQYFHKYPFRM